MIRDAQVTRVTYSIDAIIAVSAEKLLECLTTVQDVLELMPATPRFEKHRSDLEDIGIALMRLRQRIQGDKS